MKEKHGELITLVWDCIPYAEYRWARWQFIGNFEGHTHDLCIQNTKGKGMFPVTELVLKGGVK